MRITLQYPSNWSDFQNLCADLWRELMGDMKTHQNGRLGQAQNGVDFYGKYPFDHEYTGIQCKGKNGNYGSALTTKEIDVECNNAKAFIPPLGTFIMATTSPRDVNIQEYCRILTNDKTYPFSVDTWAWDDIEDEVQARESLMNKYYPKIEQANLLTEIKIARTVTSIFQRLHAFFLRPLLFGNLNKIAIEILEHLAFEIASNAFQHGHALTFSINVDRNIIYFKDDGRQFNPIDLKNNYGRGGAETIRYASTIYSLSYDYDEQNKLIIEIPNELYTQAPQERYSITFDAKDIFSRTNAQILARNTLSNIPIGTDTLIVDISGKENPAISMTFAFFDSLLSLGPQVKTIKVFLPNDLYYKESLIERYGSLTNLFFIPKE